MTTSFEDSVLTLFSAFDVDEYYASVRWILSYTYGHPLLDWLFSSDY